MDGKHHHTTHGTQIPAMLYGTAWKKERTADLVYEAIKAGFRGIDTAAMKRHYDEAGTGEGIRRAIREGLVKRDDLWIQTKFTPNDADYASKPQEYPTVAAQVRASVASSLRNLSTPSSPGHDSSSSPVDSVPYLDCLIMHSAYPRVEDTVEAWNTLREFVPAQIRTLGISNISYQEFQEYQKLEDFHLVQNRFTRTGSDWDVELRRDCLEHEILYQGFWTLTGNRADVQKAGFVKELADAVGISKEAAWYSLLIFGPGILVLNGTTNPERMRHDLEAVEKVEEWKKTDQGKEVWRRVEHDVIEFTCNQAGAPYEHVRDDGGFLCDKK
ncbi:NADP-dependent oxidoreductase domain-containing protein [Diplogelasinospora grovesii]|uniref:NADP-dependent oxidoreductase domain-containing protein n=1 Tax=Diplogelasinospora grovesii TaxID=303347 RepID=A0AAN6S9M3_9PEZI|nr:NADP-dependent oxidoreductase domain-containing protein [Diplogelasinospora grovesii]